MVRRKQTIEMLPCVVDPATQEVFVFHSDRWLPAQQWVDTAGSIFDGVNRQQNKQG